MTMKPPSVRMQYKVLGPKWDEDSHPRDRKGRFIETGAEVRIWGGRLARVLRNVGNGRIEVEREDGAKVIVHRNYLTVTARPNGEAPTDVESADVADLPEQQASPDAVEEPSLSDAPGTLPDRGGAPDRLVAAPAVGQAAGDYTVGEYVDGPSQIDGWVVGVTDSGGPIVRTEDGKDWPLLPDAEMVRAPENSPEAPAELLAPERPRSRFARPDGSMPEPVADESVVENSGPSDRNVARDMSTEELDSAVADLRRQINENPDDTTLTLRRDAYSAELAERRAPANMADDAIASELGESRAVDDSGADVPDETPAPRYADDAPTEPAWVADVTGRPAPADMTDADLREEFDALDLPLSIGDEAAAAQAEVDMAAIPEDTPGVAAMRARRGALGEEIDNRLVAGRQGGEAEADRMVESIRDLISEPDPGAMNSEQRDRQERVMRTFADNPGISEAARAVAQQRVDELVAFRESASPLALRFRDNGDGTFSLNGPRLPQIENLLPGDRVLTRRNQTLNTVDAASEAGDDVEVAIVERVANGNIVFEGGMRMQVGAARGDQPEDSIRVVGADWAPDALDVPADDGAGVAPDSPDAEPVDVDREVFDNPSVGDKVTVSLPGISHNIFTYGEDGRWHRGTVDTEGHTSDEVWAAYEHLRDSRGATIRRGGAPSPFEEGATLPREGGAEDGSMVDLPESFQSAYSALAEAGDPEATAAALAEIRRMALMERSARTRDVLPNAAWRALSSYASEGEGADPAALREALAEERVPQRWRALGDHLPDRSGPSVDETPLPLRVDERGDRAEGGNWDFSSTSDEDLVRARANLERSMARRVEGTQAYESAFAEHAAVLAEIEARRASGGPDLRPVTERFPIGTRVNAPVVRSRGVVNGGEGVVVGHGRTTVDVRFPNGNGYNYTAAQVNRFEILDDAPSGDESRRTRAEELARNAVVSAGLDPERITVTGNLYTSTVSNVQPGDAIWTQGDGSQARPVEVSTTRGGAINRQRSTVRIVSRTERVDGRVVIHFEDGTSTGEEGGSTIGSPLRGSHRVAHASAAERPATITNPDADGSGLAQHSDETLRIMAADGNLRQADRDAASAELERREGVASREQGEAVVRDAGLDPTRIRSAVTGDFISSGSQVQPGDRLYVVRRSDGTVDTYPTAGGTREVGSDAEVATVAEVGPGYLRFEDGSQTSDFRTGAVVAHEPNPVPAIPPPAEAVQMSDEDLYALNREIQTYFERFNGGVLDDDISERAYGVIDEVTRRNYEDSEFTVVINYSEIENLSEAEYGRRVGRLRTRIEYAESDEERDGFVRVLDDYLSSSRSGPAVVTDEEVTVTTADVPPGVRTDLDGIKVGDTVVWRAEQVVVTSLTRDEDSGRWTMTYVTSDGDSHTSFLPVGVSALSVTVRTPDPDAKDRASIGQTVEEMIAATEADTTLTPRARQRRMTILSDPQTQVRGGLVIHRDIDGKRDWHIASPDGIMRITAAGTNSLVQPPRTLDEAIALADRLNEIDFDWITPGVQRRISSTTGLRNRLREARESVPVQRRKAAEWATPVVPYGAATGDDVDPNHFDPSRNPGVNQRAIARQMFTYVDPETGFSTELTIRRQQNGKWTAKGKIVDADGRAIGEVERSLYKNHAGEWEAHHDLLAINRVHQGNGFADRYYKHLYEHYEKHGVDVVTILANIDVGGYAWAQRGFNWRAGHMPSGVRDSIRDNLRRAAQSVPSLTPDDRARIEAFEQRLANNEHFSPAEVANALSDIRWKGTIRTGTATDGTPTTREIDLWPGKHALLRVNWNGIFRLSEKRRIEREGPREVDLRADVDFSGSTASEIKVELERLNALLEPGDLPEADRIRVETRKFGINALMNERWNEEISQQPDRLRVNKSPGQMIPGERFYLPLMLAGDTPYAPVTVSRVEGNRAWYVGHDGIERALERGHGHMRMARPDTSEVREDWSLSSPDLDDSQHLRLVHKMFSYEDPETGYSVAIEDTDNVHASGDFGSVRGYIYGPDGDAVGTMRRLWERQPDGAINVHHSLLELPAAHQGTGFGDRYHAHLIQQYETHGVDMVHVGANMDVGGYAWAQRGYNWDDFDDLRGGLVERLEGLSVDSLTDGDRDRIGQFAQRLRDGEDFTASEVANALSDIRWTETLANGTQIDMWPGKKILLGASWNGTRNLTDRDPGLWSDPGTDPADLPAIDVYAEFTHLTFASENWRSAHGDSAWFRAAQDRLAILRAERQARFGRSEREAFGDAGEPVRAADLQPGDRVLSPLVDTSTPGGLYAAEVESVRDVGPFVVATVRDDGGIEREFAYPHDATPLRVPASQSDEVDATSVRAGSLAEGDTILVDIDGTSMTATVFSIEREDETVTVDVLMQDGTATTLVMDDGEMRTKVTGAAPTPVVETPVEDRTDAELDAEDARLAGDSIDDDLAGRPRPEARERRRREVRRERDRRDGGADGRSSAPVVSLAPDEASSRPVLYTYQRKNIVALGLDFPGTETDQTLSQAAARLRARKPLSAEQSRAMRDHLIGLADSDGVGVRQQRMYTRLAHSFDAAQAEASGAPKGGMPGERVAKGNPGILNAGDLAVILDASGKPQQVKIASIKSIMGGRLFDAEVTLEDGTTERRMFTRRQTVYALPPLPEDLPIIEDPEWVPSTKIRPGDTIRVSTPGGGTRDVVVTTSEPEVVQPTAASRQTVWRVTYATPDGGEDHIDLQPNYTRTDGWGLVRVGRGPESATQEPGTPINLDSREVVRVRDARVGDYLTGLTEDFIVTEIDEQGVRGLTLRGNAFFVPMGDVTMTRVGGVDSDVPERIKAMRRQSASDREFAEGIHGLERALDRTYADLADSAMLGVGHSREEVVRLINSRGGESGGGGNFYFNRARTQLEGRLPEERFNALRKTLMEDAVASMVEAVEGAEPLPGEAEHEMLKRILGAYEASPPRRRDIRAIVSNLTALDDPAADGGSEDFDAVDSGAPIADRIATYRKHLGGPVGQRSTYSPTYKIDLDRLEAGETPEIVYETKVQRDPDAADGGPGAHTMAQLDTVKAAGAEISREIRNRTSEFASDVLSEYGDKIPSYIRDDVVIHGKSPSAIRRDHEAAVKAAQTAKSDSSLPADVRAEATARYFDLLGKTVAIRKFEGEVRRRATYAVLSEIRDLGGHRLSLDYGARTIATNRDNHERFTKAMRAAEDVLPTDWLTSIRANQKEKGYDAIKIKAGNRGGAGHYGDMTLSNRPGEFRTLSGNGSTAVAVHELSHYAERAVTGLRESERAFYWSRTSNGEIGEREREAIERYAGDGRQYLRRDRFNEPYSGVNYADSQRLGGANWGAPTEQDASWEIFTTGIESVFGGSPYLDDDEDYMTWMLGTLALAGEPEKPRENHEPIEYPDQIRNDAPRTPRGGGSGTRRPRTQSRTVTPEVDLTTRSDASTASHLWIGADWDSVPPQVQNFVKEFETDFGGRKVTVDTSRSRFGASESGGDSSRVWLSVEPDGKSIAIDFSYRNNGQIIATIGRSGLPERGYVGFEEGFYEKMSTLFDRLGVTDVVGGPPSREGNIALWSGRGFNWKGGKPSRLGILMLRSRLRSLGERDDLSEAQKAEVHRIARLVNAASIGAGPWPSLADVVGAVDGLTDPDGGPAADWVTVDSGPLRRGTGVRRQPRRG